MKDALRAAWLLTSVFVNTAVHLIVIWAVWPYARLRGQPMPANYVHNVATSWGRMIFSSIPGWEVEIEGREHLPPAGTPYVIVANHESATDILSIYFLNIQFRWLSKEEMFRVPGVGPAMRWAGYIAIKRGDRSSHSDALAESAERLRANVPMLFFPEGTRSVAGKPKEFKQGAFKLAKECNVPVLPVVLHGSGKLLKKATIVPYPAKLQIRILPAERCGANEAVSEFTERIQNLIFAEHAQMRGESATVAASDASQTASARHRQ